MDGNKYSRRKFIEGAGAGMAGVFAMGLPALASNTSNRNEDFVNYNLPIENRAFIEEVKKLPDENLYDYHKQLTYGPLHTWQRNKLFKPSVNEFSIENINTITYFSGAGIVLKTAVEDFKDYLLIAHGVNVKIADSGHSNSVSQNSKNLVVGTKKDLGSYGDALKNSKDYAIRVENNNVIVCGFDDAGAAQGLYNLESKMNLREAPFIEKDLNIVRHSLYETRMALSWMGWMEWPDRLLAHMAHDGFDAIFLPYGNPNGNVDTAENSTDFYARVLYQLRPHDPVVVHDIIRRAEKYGIKVYTAIIFQYMGTEESEKELRELMRDILNKFPKIKGYVLLTEGFWYKNWEAWRDNNHADLKEWARNWTHAVKVVKEECSKVDPFIDILPWEYNIQFKPQNAGLKRFFVQHLPDGVSPLITWENGKGFELDGMHGYLRDYALNEIGPAEVTDAQIDEAKKRGMKVFSKVDTFASWQFGTQPYLPCPYQWYERYVRLEKYKVNSTLESWSSGYKPNFMSRLRSFTCWTNAPSQNQLFENFAVKLFGEKQKELVLKAWEHFSNAIALIPDTGPNMGTNNAVGTPLFLQQPQPRAATFKHSWSKETIASNVNELNPYWPFTVSRLVFYPDFRNQKNMAEVYVKEATGIENYTGKEILPAFLKYLQKAIDEMQSGIALYQKAALQSPQEKRQGCVREVIVTEQMLRMMQSDYAILQFENLRMQVVKKSGDISNHKKKMQQILKEEIVRTEQSLLAAKKDSRLGFQFEQDYVYTPYSLQEKINLMKDTLANFSKMV